MSIDPEIDGLRAEIERLRAEGDSLRIQLAHSGREREAFSKEIERLRPALTAAREHIDGDRDGAGHLRWLAQRMLETIDAALGDQQTGPEK